MYPQFGIPEMLTVFVSAILSLAFPIAVVYILYAIYKRLKNIDESLKKTNDDKADKGIQVK